jgi:hypothetical protein
MVHWTSKGSQYYVAKIFVCHLPMNLTWGVSIACHQGFKIRTKKYQQNFKTTQHWS